MNKIPKQFQKYFWDTDPQKIGLKKHQDYIIARLAEYGNSQAYRWLKDNFPEKTIKKVVAKNRQISPKTRNFWQIIP